MSSKDAPVDGLPVVVVPADGDLDALAARWPGWHARLAGLGLPQTQRELFADRPRTAAAAAPAPASPDDAADGGQVLATVSDRNED